MERLRQITIGTPVTSRWTMRCSVANNFCGRYWRWMVAGNTVPSRRRISRSPVSGASSSAATGRNMLVDTGLGQWPNPLDLQQPPSLPNVMQEAAISPNGIDLVLFTHLHWDNTGWNARGEEGTLTLGQPTIGMATGRCPHDGGSLRGFRRMLEPGFRRSPHSGNGPAARRLADADAREQKRSTSEAGAV